MSGKLQILVLEDNPLDAELVIGTLEQAGYPCEWKRVETREAFLRELEESNYDLILADYTLPSFDGLNALKLFLQHNLDLPFIVISGTIGEETALKCLRAGATDYVLKQNLIRIGPVVRRAICEREERHRREKAERAMREAESKFLHFVAASGDGIIMADDKGRLTYCNKSGQLLFGYTTDEIIGQPVTFLMPDRCQEAYLSALSRTHPTAGSLRRGEIHKVHGLRKDGTEFPLEISLIAWEAEGKTCHGALLRDITERRQAEAALQRSITELKRKERELRNSHEQMRALSARLTSAREEERTRISREIHDELGQVLTVLKMDLRWLEKKQKAISDSKVRDQLMAKISAMTELTDETIKTVQTIATRLRPGILDHLGLQAAIESEVKQFQAHTGIHCDLNLPREWIKPDQNVATEIFRIFQEIVTNVARHAQATHVRITLRDHGGRVLLKVEDNGRGITPHALNDLKSLGLLGIRERAEQLDGTITIMGVEGKGTSVTVRIPNIRK